MPFELHNNTQSERFFIGVETGLFEKVNEASKKSEVMRASGPFIAVASAALTLTSRVATIGETIIKGLANIFGSPFLEECNALNGLKQIFLELPISVLFLAFVPVRIVSDSVPALFGMLVIPEDYSKELMDDNLERLEYLEKSAKEGCKPAIPA